MHTLPVRVVFAGGERIGRGGPESPVMRIVRPAAFFHRLGCNSKIGFGESYMVGDWTSTELADLLTPFAARLSVLIPPLLQRIGRRFAEARQPREERNTVEGSRENIHRHYDLSNELFATFLDETMSYSSALVRRPGGDARRRPASQDRRHPGHGARRAGHARAGDRHGLGRPGHRGRRSGARG